MQLSFGSGTPEDMLDHLAGLLTERDGETGSHLYRMSLVCGLLAHLHTGNAQYGNLVRRAAVAHDVGKLWIPQSILRKPGPLTPSEYETMKRHAEIGHSVLSWSQDKLMRLAASIALTHHERFDGGGYPCGLSGEAIPLEGRIAAIGDVFEALTAPRVYRAALIYEDALTLMEAGRGTQFDPDILDLFMRAVPKVAGILTHADPAQALGWDPHVLAG